MKILMIGLDRGLLGQGSSGDVVARHRQYADMAGHIDCIIFARSGFVPKIWQEDLRAFPTNSSKVTHFRKSAALAMKLHSENNYDLLITQEFSAPAGEIVKKRTGLPWLVNIHSMFFSREWLKFNPINWYMLYRIKRAIKSADAFRVTNSVIEDKLRQWGINKPILVQPTPVDVKKFYKTITNYELRTTNLKILYVGRLAPEKNVQMLIRAFKQLTGDLELQIVGEGKEEATLKQLAQGDSRIRFLGPKAHDELVDIYGAADIFVLPSNTESFGKVLIEAAAAGCALVATRTAGAKSIITDGQDGLLVDVNNEQQLHTALKRLVEDANLRKQLADAAQAMAEKYDAEQAAANLVNFWQETVKGIFT